MKIRNLAGSGLIAAAALSLSSASAASQSVTFSTAGTFGGGSCTSSACTFGGFVLQWSGVTHASWVLPGDVVLGSFSASCGWIQCSGGSILAGSTFMLTVSQTGPVAGSGWIAGSLGWNTANSTLSWTPSQGSVTIGGVTYALDETSTGCPVANSQCINIASANTYGANRLTNVTDDVASTTTPEPATVALMATGLVGLVPVARRRRRS